MVFMTSIMKNISKQIDRLFPPKYFNDSEINTILTTKEKQIMIILRDKEYADLYSNFDDQFETYLKKLSSSNAKKFVSKIFSDRLVFIGMTSGQRVDSIFSRLLISDKGNIVNGIVLDSNVLDIDIATGDTSSIDNCIYATYFSIIRSGVIANSAAIIKDIDLHKLVSHYIYLITLRAVGQQSIYNKKQKILTYLVCLYIYFSHFLKLKHSNIISNLKNKFKTIIDQEILKELLPSLSGIKTYSSMKDLPKALVDVHIYNDNPSKLILNYFKILGNSGFYSFISTLDQLISMIVMTSYPSTLYNKFAYTSENIHKAIEDKMTEYIKQVKFVRTSMFYGNSK
jgi:hypothetical protein